MAKRRKTMPPREISPSVLRHGRTAQGLSCELRWDPQGVLELPGLDEVLVVIHMGPSTRLSYRGGGNQYRGTGVHRNTDIIPADTTMRWEMHDQNDRSLMLGLPHAVLRSVAQESELDSARMEILNRFQVRDNELETLS